MSTDLSYRICFNYTGRDNDRNTSANVVYDTRAGVMIGRIGHYRELSMKKSGKQWVVEKVLKDIRSGMGDVR